MKLLQNGKMLQISALFTEQGLFFDVLSDRPHITKSHKNFFLSVTMCFRNVSFILNVGFRILDWT